MRSTKLKKNSHDWFVLNWLIERESVGVNLRKLRETIIFPRIFFYSCKFFSFDGDNPKTLKSHLVRDVMQNNKQHGQWGRCMLLDCVRTNANGLGGEGQLTSKTPRFESRPACCAWAPAGCSRDDCWWHCRANPCASPPSAQTMWLYDSLYCALTALCAEFRQPSWWTRR